MTATLYLSERVRIVGLPWAAHPAFSEWAFEVVCGDRFGGEFVAREETR